jgi:hypothetical protein
MYDIDKYGIGKVMEMVNDHLNGKNIHLSYDIDALDPFFAPHTGTFLFSILYRSVFCFVVNYRSVFALVITAPHCNDLTSILSWLGHS